MDRLWKSDLKNGKYQNPILFADYSDPDVIRVEDTYYMTASSFNYVPGLPILISRDLVNWKLVNYAISSIDYAAYDVPQHAKGVWAPSIRYHKGIFYIVYGMPDEGLFVVKTKDPLGKWEKPVCILPGKGLIDPCPFFEEDGRIYIVHGYAKSRIGFKSCLGIFETDRDMTQAISEDHILYDGIETQPTIEGPKVYKRDGFYYILAPAGGVRQGWQTALRSKSLFGPFEEKVVMKQAESKINGPHQGGLVDTVTGQDWFIHFQDRGLYGRITHLQPVRWIDGWPVMGHNIRGYYGEPVTVWDCPDTGIREDACYLEASDDFQGDTLNLMWQWMGNPRKDFYSLAEGQKGLRLYSKGAASQKGTLWECSNVLTQKLVCPQFKAECCLHADALQQGERAGLVMMGGEYAFAAVENTGEETVILYGRSCEDKENGGKREEVKRVASLREKEVLFFLEMLEGGEIRMYYQAGSGEKIEIREAASFTPSDHTWVGAKLGLFAVAEDGGKTGGYADFEYIHVTGR